MSFRRWNFRWSITARLVCTTIVIASVAMVIFTFFVARKLDVGYQHQKVAVGKLARLRLSQQMTLQAKLLSSAVDHLVIRTREAGFTVAAGQALGTALEEADSDKIGRVLADVVKTSQFDSLVAFDPKMKVLGTHRPNILRTRVLDVFEHSLISRARGIAFANNPAKPYAYSDLEKAREEGLRALGIEVSEDQLAIVSIHPVFDSRGKVLAVILGHKLITPSEPSILRIDETGGIGLRIYNDEQALLSVRLQENAHFIPDPANSFQMGQTIGGAYLFKCRLLRANFRVCVYKPESEISAITKDLVSYVKIENVALLKWLLGLAAILLGLCVITTWISSNRIIAPLRHITRAVHSVAKGNWLADIGWVKRSDEVGEIARAVAVLQKSMKERERLRSDVAQFEQLKSQRSDMEQAIELSQSALRQCLFNLSDLVESVESGNSKLAGMVGVVAGEADEARLVTSRLLVVRPGAVETSQRASKDPEAAVLENFDRLGGTIGTLKSDTKNLSHSVVKLIQEAQSADRIVKQLMSSVRNDNEQKTHDLTSLRSNSG